MLNILILVCLSISTKAAELVVWNVGQGQWISEIHPQICLHFDLGGERDPTKKVLQYCRDRKNFINLSHWDWDHISFVRNFYRKAPHACLVSIPNGPRKAWKEKFLSDLKLCSPTERELLKKFQRKIARPQQFKDSNQSSEVLWSSTFQVLVPGDSPVSQERRWRFQVPQTTKGLILGHHGSRTSSSKELLGQLSNLRWTVASARRSRYGHPHFQVIERLEKEKVPLLKTEDWGHLHFIGDKP